MTLDEPDDVPVCPVCAEDLIPTNDGMTCGVCNPEEHEETLDSNTA